MRVLAVTVAFLLAGLSGCAENDGSPTSSQAAPSSTAPTVAASPAKAALPPAPIQTPTCAITRTEASANTGIGIHVDRVLFGVDECHLETMANGNLTGYSSALVEVDGGSLQATETALHAVIISKSCLTQLPVPTTPSCTIASADGAPTLAMAITKDRLKSYGADDMQVNIWVEGVAVQHLFTIHLTLFFVGDPPVRYTAIT